MSTKMAALAEPRRSWRSVGEHDSEGDWARDVETSEMGEKSRYHQQENEKKKKCRAIKKRDWRLPAGTKRWMQQEVTGAKQSLPSPQLSNGELRASQRW